MRWKYKPKQYPKHQDRRTIHKLLLFPIFLPVGLNGTELEYRWLERAYIRQIRNGSEYGRWVNLYFES